MDKLDRIWAALCSAAVALAAAPALVLAQTTGGPTGAGSSPLVKDAPERAGGGSGWLWIVLAIAVIAVVWYAISQRRTATRAH